MTRFAVVCLFVAAMPVFAADPPKPEDAKKAAKKTAEEYGVAFAKGDFAAQVDRLHDPVVKLMGGKEAAVKGMTEMAKRMDAQGIKFKGLTVGDPGDLHTEGDNTFVVIPTTVEISIPDGKAVQKTFVLGISADAGKTWKFVDGGGIQDKKVREMVLPKMPAKLELPEPKSPEVTKDK